MTTDNTKTADQTVAVQPVATREIDGTAIEAKWQEQRDVAAAAHKLDRTALLEVLRGKSIVVVEASYDGYGDSGNVDAVTLTPEDIKTSSELEEQLRDFIWSVAYAQFPGFEINDGGRGEFKWDISKDRICLDHDTFFTDSTNEFVEDV